MELIDRAFFKGISTVRTLSAEGLPRPPADTRSELYGLYKQATEGDIRSFMARPEDGDEIGQKKWDAWKSFKGIHSAEAKKRYIQLLLDTMREYATGTTRSRELLTELELAWNQVRDIPTRESSPYGLGLGGFGGLSSRLTVGSDSVDERERALQNKRATDIDDAELRQWKREVSRAMETINEQVYMLRNQVSELSHSQSYRDKVFAMLKPFFGVLLRVTRHFLIDLAVILVVAYLARYARRKPDSKLSRNMNMALRYISARLTH